MLPSEIRIALAHVDERLCSWRVTLRALALLAAVAAAAALLRTPLPHAFAVACAALSIAGALAALVACRLVAAQRDDVYDEVLLAGYRHVDEAVQRRAQQLLSARWRRQLAGTLDRFLTCATTLQPTAVPLNRRALRRCAPRVRAICSLLVREDVVLEAAGVVLLTRLLSDGATSPLFRPSATVRALERELDRIAERLSPVGAVSAAA